MKEKIEEGIISLSHVSAKFQGVDILTQAMPRPRFEFFVSKLGIIDVYSPTWGGALNFEYKNIIVTKIIRFLAFKNITFTNIIKFLAFKNFLLLNQSLICRDRAVTQ